jgi:hypothetical protein
MVALPRILVAATCADIAGSLEKGLKALCKERGLLLQVGPQPGGGAYDSSEHLFFELSNMHPAELLDTLVVLHVGPALEECFESKVSNNSSGWHVPGTVKPGVALELALRFPQVFPVFLSPLAPPRDVTKATPTWPEFKGWLAGWEEDAKDDPTPGADSPMLPAWENIHFASSVDGFAGLKQTLDRFANGFRSVFDPTGFRSLMRNRFLAQVFGEPTRGSDKGEGWANTRDARGQLNRRLGKLAVVIEEESDLMLLSGYAAYKFGYRSWMINTYSEFANYGTPDWGQARDLLLIRDIDLRLPDIIPSDNRQASIRADLRNIHSTLWVERLAKKSDFTARALSQDPDIVDAAELKPARRHTGQCEIIAHLKARAAAAGRPADLSPAKTEAFARRTGQTCACSGRRKFAGLTKPLGSIYSATGLFDGGSAKTPSLISTLPQAEEMRQQAAHGAPYMNLRIATDLIRQSRQCREGRETRPLLVAALLGQEAYSLLLGMSRSTALAALREVHLAEAAVESSSTGITYSVSIRERRKDVIRSVENVCPEEPGLNFLAKLWADLRLVYKDGEQFEASERANIESLVNARWLTLPRRQRRRAAGLRKAVMRVKRALLQPLHSFYYLLAFWLIWSLILTILYCASQSRWVFSATGAGLLNFFDVYVRVLVAIGRAEKISEEHLDVGSYGMLYILNRVTDVLCAITSVLAIGLVVSVIFRKSTRG